MPLNALLQHRSRTHEKGRIQATKNFLNTVAIMLASGALALSSALHVPPDRILQILGVATVALGITSLGILPELQAGSQVWRDFRRNREVEPEVPSD